MPDPTPPRDRTAGERQTDHEGLARLSESLVPALVQKLNASALGELEVREGEWRIRLRRQHPAARRERTRLAGSAASRQPPPTPGPASIAASGPRGNDDPARALARPPPGGLFPAVPAGGAPG